MTPPPADRDAYEARQAELLRALMRGDGFPGGFDAVKADAAGRSLRRKRARAVTAAWPALAISLGADFAERFDAFARETPPPAFGFGYTDGLAFARGLEPGERTDDVRAELLLARAVIAGGARARGAKGGRRGSAGARADGARRRSGGRGAQGGRRSSGGGGAQGARRGSAGAGATGGRRGSARTGAMRARRGVFVGAIALREPRRILIVHRTPLLGRRVIVVPLGR